MKITVFFLLFGVSFGCYAQVGINTTLPNAVLDIRSSNQAAPTNTDGILIPKIDAFPVTNPTAAQQGMLVYLTTVSGTLQPGFYYWNQPTTAWIPFLSGSLTSGTLDQAYDFGGAGLGKTITADAGALLINGTDGLVSTGTVSSGAIVPSGVGTRMVWNPRKAAFRAGNVEGTQWEDFNVGEYSVAFGRNATASGSLSTASGAGATASGSIATAFGNGTTASGIVSTAFGDHSTASGVGSTSFGLQTTASGAFSTAFGSYSTASGQRSTVFGYSNTAVSFGETIIGFGATNYTPTTNGDTQFRLANVTDRLFVIGNALDANNNSVVDAAERSDALIILKNGLTRLPSATNAMITAADGKAVVTKEYLQSNTSGTLDQAYDFGGAGAGKMITADTGAVLINGTDGLVSTGTSGSGIVAPSGAGTRMVWNPRKAAFRAGNVIGTEWDDVNLGLFSFATGSNSRATANASAAFGFANIASGQGATAFGVENTASGNYSTAFGFINSSTGNSAVVFGQFSTASGSFSSSLGSGNIASGTNSTTIGQSNTSRSFAETVFGVGATNYTPTANGDTQFRTTNATDRLFVVGNAIDADNDNSVDLAERSDALIILKNGLTRLPSTTNAMITAADGKAVVTKEYLENTSGTLDQAYDFGGAGLGKTITADAGAVLIDGTDGFVSTGTSGSGIVAPSGAGTRMVWNPRKSAFRAGTVFGNQWDDANLGLYSTVFGLGSTASGYGATAFGLGNIANGYGSTAFGNANTASGGSSTVFGVSNTSSGDFSTAYGNGNTSSGDFSTVFGTNNTASGTISTAFGNSNIASGIYSTTFGNRNTSSGNQSIAFGFENSSSSFGEITLGIGATTYTPSLNGASQFRAANVTDRLLVVGNAIDANNNSLVDAAERRDAMVILKNGLTRLPSTTNAMITAADGKVIVTKEYLQSNTSAWGLTGNAGTNPTTSFIGTTDNQSLVFRTNDTNRMAITGAGEVGIGTLVPSERLDVGVGNIAVTGGDIYLSAANGVLNAGGGLMSGLINYIGDAFVAPTVVNGDEDLYIADDIELGGQAYKPGGGAWVTTSDRRLKRNIEPYTDGLESILKINPVTYQYNSLYKTLDNGETYVGIIAQEMQQVAPYMVEEKPFGRVVEEDEKGNEKIVNQGTPYLTFDGSALTYMLINAMKEMNVKNELLQQENQALKKSVLEMNQKMELIITEIEKLKK